MRNLFGQAAATGRSGDSAERRHFLIYHPHLHYLVPGGGLSLDGCQWVASKRKFLLPQLSAAEQAAWQMPADSFDPLVPEEVPVEPRPWLCPQCQRPLILHATWLAGQMPPRPPAVPIRGPP